MIPALLLALREGLEAALIVGIVLGALRKTGGERLKPVVWAGTLSAAAISLIGGLVLYRLGAAFEGTAEAVFEGLTMLLAAGVLTWMIFWMRRQARSLGAELEADVRQATRAGSKMALFALAFLAVVREGIELALFLTATTFTAGEQATLIGAALGLVAAIALGWGLFSSLIRLNLRQFFTVSSALLILFAAGLVAHGVHELNEAGWIPAVIEHVWDINFLLDENSTLGLILKTLVGYNGNPSLTEVLAYIGYFVGLAGLLRRERVAPALQAASSP